MTAEMIMTIHSNLFLLRNEDYYRGERWKTVTVILKMKNVNTFRVIKWKKRQILTASFVTAH